MRFSVRSFCGAFLIFGVFKMKKILIYLLTLTLVFSMFSSSISISATENSISDGNVKTNVKNSSNPNKTEQLKNELDFGGATINIMRDWSPYVNGMNAAWDNFNNWVDICEARFNVKISEKKWKATLSGEMLSGIKPEGHLYLVGNSGGNIYEMSQKGYITPLDDAMAKTGIDMTADHYNEFNVNINCFNGKHWKIGIGFARIKATVLYNKELVEAAGYQKTGTTDTSIQSLIDNNKWTWKKMTEIAKKTTKRNNSGEVTQWGIGIDEAGIQGMVLSNDGQLVFPDRSGILTSQLGTENVKEAIQQVYDWYHVDKVASAFKNTTQSMSQAFADGKIAMIIGGHEVENDAHRSDIDFGVAYLPMGPKADGYSAYMEDEYGYVIPSAYKDMASELLLLVDELHYWPVKGYIRDDQFRDEWTRYFKNAKQYKMWYNHHFSPDVERKWDATKVVNTGLNFNAIIIGSQTPAVWTANEDARVTANLKGLDYVYGAGDHLKHNYVVTKNTRATLSNNGSKEKVCSECGHTVKSVIYKPKTIQLSKTTYTYNGKVQTPEVIVKDSAGMKLYNGIDYKVTYPSGRKYSGTYKIKVTFIGDYSGSKTINFIINPIKAERCSAKLSTTSYTYNGKTKTPTVVVKNPKGTTLKKGTHYLLQYASGRKNAGKYKVTVKFVGDYSGTKNLYFNIKPPKTTISKVTAGSNKLTLNITKKSSQVTGYQIQYSTSKSFSSYKTKTIKSYKTTKTTLYGLRSKTTYYTRVRTYKTINGTKYYSGWSTAKSAKVK